MKLANPTKNVSPKNSKRKMSVPVYKMPVKDTPKLELQEEKKIEPQTRKVSFAQPKRDFGSQTPRSGTDASCQAEIKQPAPEKSPVRDMGCQIAIPAIEVQTPIYA